MSRLRLPCLVTSTHGRLTFTTSNLRREPFNLSPRVDESCTEVLLMHHSQDQVHGETGAFSHQSSRSIDTAIASIDLKLGQLLPPPASDLDTSR